MDMTPQDREQWAISRNTHSAVAEAIWWLAHDNESEAQRIWDDPTREEWLAIWERVTNNGLRDGDEYEWGIDRLGNVYPADR